jgi:hypothetical protein
MNVERAPLRNQLADISVHMMPQLGCLIQIQNGPDRLEREIPEDWDLQVCVTYIYCATGFAADDWIVT